MIRTFASRLVPMLAWLAPLALAACGGASRSVADASVADPGLAGRWRSGCVDPGSGQALRLTFDLTATTWALAYESFGDAACTAPMLVVNIDGAYEVTGPSQIAGAREARFGFDHKAVTPSAAGAVGFLQQACGGATFAVGTATDISAGCPGLGGYPITTCPADYDLVAHIGDHLQFGSRPADNNMCTPARRPTKLSGIALERQP